MCIRARLGGFAALVGILASGQVWAKCTTAGDCICWAAAPQAATGHISLVANGQAVVTVDARVGLSPDGGGMGGELTLPSEGDDAVGRQVLVGLAGESVKGRIDVAAGGKVPCSGHDFTAEQAAAALVAPDCFAALREDGLVPPPCHDVGCGSAGGLSLLGLLPLLALRRRSTAFYPGRTQRRPDPSGSPRVWQRGRLLR